MLPLGRSLWRPALMATHSLFRLTTTCNAAYTLEAFRNYNPRSFHTALKQSGWTVPGMPASGCGGRLVL